MVVVVVVVGALAFACRSLSRVDFCIGGILLWSDGVWGCVMQIIMMSVCLLLPPLLLSLFLMKYFEENGGTNIAMQNIHLEFPVQVLFHAHYKIVARRRNNIPNICDMKHASSPFMSGFS